MLAVAFKMRASSFVLSPPFFRKVCSSSNPTNKTVTELLLKIQIGLHHIYKVQPKRCKIFSICLFLQIALHVSGGSSANHQEHKTVHTASGIVKPILPPAAFVDEMELVPPRQHAVQSGSGTLSHSVQRITRLICINICALMNSLADNAKKIHKCQNIHFRL
jgi:hypothetical protein